MAQELEIAKQVQARLFPQKLPSLKTLDYAGVCLQARQVGGDYYDFLSLGQERLGIIIGDISGKGIAAALLMANFQANLRSQSAMALEEPEHFLKSVNQLFYENTAESAYATIFFAEYDDNGRRVRYANCGHYAGLLLRRDGTLERLESTCTVLGLFKEWDCSIAEREWHSTVAETVSRSLNQMTRDELPWLRLDETRLKRVMVIGSCLSGSWPEILESRHTGCIADHSINLPA